MKAISIHVSEPALREFQRLATRQGRSVAELIREAMAEYLERENRKGPSIFTIQPHPSGRLLAPWTRSEILEEMTEP